jgi:prepilin-type N-terminal cleavage/methylation domain-containing protein
MLSKIIHNSGWRQAEIKKQAAGFTLIELLVVIGIITFLFGIGSIALSNLIPAANVSTSSQTLVAELKSQQLKAMLGETGGGAGGGADEYGIRLLPNGYALFKGAVYDPTDQFNLVVDFGLEVSVSTTAPGSSVVFTRGSGEIAGVGSGGVTITISSNLDQQSSVINLNHLGVVTGIN